MSDKVELKPCPFCRQLPMKRKFEDTQIWFVKCDTIKCAQSGMPWLAIDKWNTRHPNPELLKALEGCSPCVVCDPHWQCSVIDGCACDVKRDYDKCLELAKSP